MTLQLRKNQVGANYANSHTLWQTPPRPSMHTKHKNKWRVQELINPKPVRDKNNIRIMVIDSPAHVCRESITSTGVEYTKRINLAFERKPKRGKQIYEVKINVTQYIINSRPIADVFSVCIIRMQIKAFLGLSPKRRYLLNTKH